jgi:arginase family enzyme
VARQTKGDAATGWVLLGTPLDCSGNDRGEAHAPGALRDAGLAQKTGARDAGDVDATVDDPNRDARTGVIGFEQIRRASSEIDSAVAAVLDEGEKPLVVGGDCTVLVGALAAAKERVGRVGLAFVDGHLDFFGGETSPSGEAADMDLAFVTGYGAEGLVDLAGPPPIAKPGDVVVMGHRADPREGGPARWTWWTRGFSWSKHQRSNAVIPRGWGTTSPRGSRRRPGTFGCTSTWTSSTKRRCRPSPTRCPTGSVGSTRRRCYDR